MIYITFWDNLEKREFVKKFYTRREAWCYLCSVHHGHRLVVLLIEADDNELMKGLY